MVRDVTALQAVTRNRVSRTQQEKSGTFLMRGGPGGEKKKGKYNFPRLAQAFSMRIAESFRVCFILSPMKRPLQLRHHGRYS